MTNKYIFRNWIPLSLLAVGVMLLIYMVLVEDEPGALPLFLIIVSGVWLWVKRREYRRNTFFNR
jgi:hypothetical protein